MNEFVVSTSHDDAERFSADIILTTTSVKRGKLWVARSLDLDIVTMAESEKEASEALRWAVKCRIEYGLQNNLDASILSHAPEKFWREPSVDWTMKLGEPIHISAPMRFWLTTGERVRNDDRRAVPTGFGACLSPAADFTRAHEKKISDVEEEIRYLQITADEFNRNERDWETWGRILAARQAALTELRKGWKG